MPNQPSKALWLSCLILFSVVSAAQAADYRTANFVVTASSADVAKRVALAAERYRKTQAEAWLGKQLPRWQDLCPITVRSGEDYRATGRTSFVFRNRQPRSWRMSVTGSLQKILDAVLPHEVMHTVFATHFGRPLPRWADEGACVLVEPTATQHRLLSRLVRDARDRHVWPLQRLFAADAYPADILPFYAQGFSLTHFLVSAGGREKFVRFLGDGMNCDWPTAARQHYGYEDIRQLSSAWLEHSLKEGHLKLASAE